MNNVEWYEQADLKEYAGKWIAIHNEHVSAADEDLKKVLDATKNQEDAFIIHIPKRSLPLVYNA